MATPIRSPWFDCVIDEGGESWMPQSSAYARRLGYSDRDFDLASYAVRNLGHARLTLRGGAMHVAFRPAIVNAVTLAGVFLTVFDNGPGRVALNYHAEKDVVRHEIFGTPQLAMARMEDLVLAAQPSWPRFIAEQRALLQLDPAVAGPMLALIDLWQLSSARWSPTFFTHFKVLGVSERAMVARMSAHSHRMVIDECGRGYTFAEASWRETLVVGRDVEDQPDREYGAWAAEEYRRAAGDGRTLRIESINALIRTPGVAARRSRYVRLLLPWQASGGDRVVTSISFVKTSARVA